MSPLPLRSCQVLAAPAAVLTALVATGAVAGAATGEQRRPHVGNPYAGARGYVNPEWKANARGEPGGARVADTPTGVWLDRVAKIRGTAGRMGLRAHLDAALAQGAGYRASGC
jgi:cellulose 1,4-beta-cellobiosidase